MDKKEVVEEENEFDREHKRVLAKKAKKPKGKCKLCGKTLIAVGHARKGGKNNKDWGTRDYHKKCWQEYIADDRPSISFIAKFHNRKTRNGGWSNGEYVFI